MEMDLVTIVAAIAAISAIGVVVSTLVSSSRDASTGGQAHGVGSPPPADPKEREYHAGQGGPNRARGVQLVSAVVLAVAIVVLAFLLLF
jgi:hypothetical protein